MARASALLLLSGLLAWPEGAAAHESGAAYLRLEAQGRELAVELDLQASDARALLGLTPEAGAEAEARPALEERREDLVARIGKAIGIEDRDSPCALDSSEPAFAPAPDDPGWIRLRFRARCRASLERPTLRYDLLFDLDPEHRAHVMLHHGHEVQSAVIGLGTPPLVFDLRPPSALRRLVTYLREGAHHVSTGFDHLLFLVTLMLPAPLVRREGGWVAEPRAGRALARIAGVVTAFTLAHSITLALAVLDWVRLPSRGVEVAIALSVMLAGLHNLAPVRSVRGWQLAGAFGLIHGFGFASQLRLLGLPPVAKGTALLGFNLGVELGQLALVAVCLPLLLGLRRWRHYPRFVLEVPSVAIVWLAAVWGVERAFGVRLLW